VRRLPDPLLRPWLAFSIADGEQGVGIAKTAMPVTPSTEETPKSSTEETPKSKYGHVDVTI